MFRLGFWEIITLVLAALIFIRPKDLPALFRRVGLFFGRLSRFRQTFEEEMQNISTVDTTDAMDTGKKEEE